MAHVQPDNNQNDETRANAGERERATDTFVGTHGQTGTRSDIEGSKVYRWLGILERLLVPASLIVLIIGIFNISPTSASIISVAVVAISAVVLFWHHYWKRALTVMLLVLCFALASSLVYTLYFLEDPWIEWSKKLSGTIKKCNPDNDLCVATALAQPRPSPDSNLLTARLDNDLQAGIIIMKNERARDMLAKRLGIREWFLGTGIAQPTGENDYSAARIPEYLIPNYEERSNGVWSWQFDPLDPRLEQKLGEVIEQNLPTQVLQAEDAPTRDKQKKRFQDQLRTIKSRLHIGDKMPPVVRVAQFPKDEYSYRLGRKEASRVFAIHLGTVWGFDMKDVAKYSGRTITINDARREHKFFIWIFVPAHEWEVVPATWGDILPRLAEWVKP